MKTFFHFVKEGIQSKNGRVVRFWGLMLFLGMLTCFYGRGIVQFKHHLGLYDWDFAYFLHQYWHIAVFSFKQLPLWNPYIGGGMSFVGRPDVSMTPFPLFFVISFGVVTGLKLMALSYIFLSMAGMFYLSRYLGMGRLAALISSVLFSMSGCFALRIMAGHLGWLSAAYLPWIFLFYLKGLKNIRYLFVCSVFLSLMAFEGIYILIFSVMFLAMFGGLSSIQHKTFRPILAVALAVVLCGLLSGPKIFPVMELMLRFPRPTEVWRVVPFKNLYNVFLDRAQYDNFFQRFMKHTAWWELGAYVGIVPLGLFVLSFRLIRRHWPLLLTAVSLLLIGIGNFSPFAPWTMLHRYPVFSDMNMPSRIWIVFIFVSALLCGLSLESFKAKTARGIYLKNSILAVLFCFIAWDLMAVNTVFFNKKFFSSANMLRRPVFQAKPFRQTNMPEQYQQIYGAATAFFPQIFQNRGIVNGYEAIPIKRHAVPQGDPAYRGEFYLLDQGGELSQKYWSPNKLVFHYNIDRPDVLVVNQNYDKSWRTSQKRMVKSHDGLISVELQAGEGQVTLYYFPASFAYGIVSFVAGVLLFIVMIKKKIEWPALKAAAVDDAAVPMERTHQ